MKSKPAVVSAPSDQYEVEHALHVLTEADRHRRDPKMMKAVAKLAAEKKDSLARVARMKPNTKPQSKSKR